MALGDDDFGPVLLNFHDFVHVLLTRWIYPPDHPHPLAVEAEVLDVAFPDPPEDPTTPAVQSARAPSPPPSPPHTPPPVLPPISPERDPDLTIDPLEPIYDPYGIHDHGYIDPLTLHLAPPSPPATTAPPPPQPPYWRMARISTITSIGETFRFTYLHQLQPAAFEGSSYEDSSSSESKETSGSGGESEEEWCSASDTSDD